MAIAKILSYEDNKVLIETDNKSIKEIVKHQSKVLELRVVDGRIIEPEQRRKIFAIIGDIADWTGYIPEEMRYILTWRFCGREGIEDFSLSNCEKSVACDFINYLINFCFLHNIPTRDTLLALQDDIFSYLYACLVRRKCAICNVPADVHHVDKVGMGRYRKKINHLGLRAIALCRKHHMEAHNSEIELFEKHHIYGIKLDKCLCNVLKLNYIEE